MNQNDESIIRIDLTDTQKEQVRHATGKDAEAIELDAKSLEERITPRPMFNP